VLGRREAPGAALLLLAVVSAAARVSAQGLASEPIVFADIRSENADAPSAYALYVRIRPWIDKAFDIKQVRFDRPGIIRVFCEIHSHMNAFILVFSHPFFALADADGRYRIESVPPVSYGLIAWSEGVSSDPRPVTVPEGGVAEMDFLLK